MRTIAYMWSGIIVFITLLGSTMPAMAIKFDATKIDPMEFSPRAEILAPTGLKAVAAFQKGNRFYGYYGESYPIPKGYTVSADFALDDPTVAIVRFYPTATPNDFIYDETQFGKYGIFAVDVIPKLDPAKENIVQIEALHKENGDKTKKKLKGFVLPALKVTMKNPIRQDRIYLDAPKIIYRFISAPGKGKKNVASVLAGFKPAAQENSKPTVKSKATNALESFADYSHMVQDSQKYEKFRDQLFAELAKGNFQFLQNNFSSEHAAAIAKEIKSTSVNAMWEEVISFMKKDFKGFDHITGPFVTSRATDQKTSEQIGYSYVVTRVFNDGAQDRYKVYLIQENGKIVIADMVSNVQDELSPSLKY